MGEVLPLPHRGDVFLDPRGEGRSLRVSGHRDAATVVLSIWRQGECRATFRLSGGEVDDFVRALMEAAPPAAPGTFVPAAGGATAPQVLQLQISGNVVVELNHPTPDVEPPRPVPAPPPADVPAAQASPVVAQASPVAAPVFTEPVAAGPAPAADDTDDDLLDEAATTGDVLARFTGPVAVPEVTTAPADSADPAESPASGGDDPAGRRPGPEPVG